LIERKPFTANDQTVNIFKVNISPIDQRLSTVFQIRHHN